MITRGYLGNSILGTLGMIVGISIAKRYGIHHLQIYFADGGVEIAEVDDAIISIMTGDLTDTSVARNWIVDLSAKVYNYFK